MTDPVDFDAKRKAKTQRCEVCGAPVHKGPGLCPRVSAIHNDPDGGTTYYLWPIEDPDPPLAG